MVGQCVLIDQTISDVQKKVKTINETKLLEIRREVSAATSQVIEFLEEELPKYKKLFFDSEVSIAIENINSIKNLYFKSLKNLLM